MELNFQGFVVTDWGAQHSGLKSANAGLDMAMPTSAYWDNEQLASAVQNGSFSYTRLRDMTTRIIAAWYQLNQDDEATPASRHPGVGIPANLSQPHDLINARDPTGKLSLLQQSIEGHVLVKNTGSLPLKKPSVLSLFGYDAPEPMISGPHYLSLAGDFKYDVWQLQWESVNLTGQDLTVSSLSNPPNRTSHGTLFCGGGSGANTPPYIDSPYNAISRRAYDDDTALYYNFEDLNPVIIGSSEACLVFVNQFSSEIFDRGALNDAYSDKLILNVASQCKNTIVVIHNAGIRIVDAWIEHENITAVIFAHLPGQDSGRALVEILYGGTSPSGRLPYTVAKNSEDYGSLLSPCTDEGDDPQCSYTEGVNIDYRHFLVHNIKPRFEFGFGLTYTKFNYSDLQIDIEPGFSPHSQFKASININERNLFDNVALISATVTNIGNTAAAEVAQLYLQLPGETRALRGFDKVMIEPRASARVKFKLRRKDVSSWDTLSQDWVVLHKPINIFVGPSVYDTPLDSMLYI